jgi:DNA-directed RNA polymerase subunit N (RpoN/RPB10)
MSQTSQYSYSTPKRTQLSDLQPRLDNRDPSHVTSKEVNLLPAPACTCYKPLARMSKIRKYMRLLREGVDPKIILTEINFTRPCCRTHFPARLLTKHRE